MEQIALLQGLETLHKAMKTCPKQVEIPKAPPAAVIDPKTRQRRAILRSHLRAGRNLDVAKLARRYRVSTNIIESELEELERDLDS
jgi:hypothetical protein